MIHLDTSVLVDALTGPRRSAPALRALIAEGERISFSALVLYEWLCGPRRPEETRVQEALFPPHTPRRSADPRPPLPRNSIAPCAVREAVTSTSPSPLLPSCTTRPSGR